MADTLPTWSHHVRVTSHLASVPPLLSLLLDRLRDFGWLNDDIFGIHLAVEEALVNAIRHGNRQRTEKRVDVSLRITVDSVWIQITDEGPGFNPTAVPDPRQDEHLTVPSGRGVLLMRHYMTRVEFNSTGNQVTMTKTRAT